MIDTFLLFPYYLTLKIRNSLYDKGFCTPVKAPVPTICIGNVSAGGTGKSPHTEMVLKLLLESDEWGGKNIAMLSRGYKRQSKGFRYVNLDDRASLCGDEPVMVKKRVPAVTVAVDEDRIDGCRRLHESKEADNRSFNPPADIIVLDDAFQYRKLKADIDIALTDYSNPFFKDKLLPLGRLRDLRSRMFDADIIIVTKCPDLDPLEKEEFLRSMGMTGYNPDTCEAVNRYGRRQLVMFTRICYNGNRAVFEDFDHRYIYSKKIIVFTGIAKDAPLCNYLSDSYGIVSHLKFHDHHRYSNSDINKIESAIRKNPTAGLATTDKDAQRIVDVEGIPKTIRERLFSVPISVDFLSETEKRVFRERIIKLKPKIQ